MHERLTMKRTLAWLILVCCIFCAGVGYGLMSYEFELFPYFQVRKLHISLTKPKKPAVPPGSWRRLEGGRSDPGEIQELVEQLQSIGYVTGSVPATTHTGVTIFNAEAVSPGLNLHCSGHAAEALLTSLDGEVLHSWQYDFSKAWPHRKIPKGATGPGYWRRIHIYENGDLLAIFEGFGLIRIDKNSTLRWALSGGYHHDLEVTASGEIWVLDRVAHLVPRINSREPILEDFVAVISPDGEVLRRFSILEAFERSQFDPLLHRMEKSSDIFHTNALEILDGSLSDLSPFFHKGNLLISLLMLETIAIIDVETETVVWALTGKWKGQHHPTVLGNGNMMLFNNKAGDEQSRVMEFSPFTQEVVWSYEGNVGDPFYTETCGSSQRLPNGNTLITESDTGRAFEISPEKEVIWEYINPQRAGENGEYIAMLPEVIRLPSDFPVDWIDRVNER
jgi:hypothetical protein